ncbi:hypothetical protein ABQE48_16560 [Mycolicibacterium thermoresistibile]
MPSGTRRIELPSTAFCGATIVVKVSADEKVIGLDRVEWNRDYPPDHAAVIQQVHWELRGPSYNVMTTAEQERVDKKAQARAWELWETHQDAYYAAEGDMPDLDAAIKDANQAVKDAIKRHKFTSVDDLARAFDEDWRVKEASEYLYQEYADAAAQFLLNAHRNGK